MRRISRSDEPLSHAAAAVSLRAQEKSRDPTRPNDPTGKSLLFVGSHVKPDTKKYFCFPESQINVYN
jgi:hypothetical protein